MMLLAAAAAAAALLAVAAAVPELDEPLKEVVVGGVLVHLVPYSS